MVFVLDSQKKPLMPCTEKRARLMLRKGKAVIQRVFPFTIRLKGRIGGKTQPVRLKIDPGSKVTGIAIMREESSTQHVLHLAELQHRGASIRQSLSRRTASRRRRRTANLRYRAPRFLNRVRPKGWLAPSLQHRVDSTLSWLARYRRWCPINAISQELIKFDTQLLENAEISGADYQRGTLAETELREYVLERDGRKCVYCGKANVPLNLDHVEPRSKGGSNRPSNLLLACVPCNERKSNRDIREFLKGKPDVLRRVLMQVKKQLRDAAAVNATRWALWRRLSEHLPVETGTGGRTKWNRTKLWLPKTHALDAACVGDVDSVLGWHMPTLCVKSCGRGRYQRALVDSFGFPRGHRPRHKQMHGFQTGDLVSATLSKGKHIGTHLGRVSVRATGIFDITNPVGRINSIRYEHCRLVQRADGYSYSQIQIERSGTFYPCLKTAET